MPLQIDLSTRTPHSTMQNFVQHLTLSLGKHLHFGGKNPKPQTFHQSLSPLCSPLRQENYLGQLQQCYCWRWFLYRRRE